MDQSPEKLLESKTAEIIRTTVERAGEILPEMKVLYIDFHENPELGGQEIETSKKIIAYLESLGIEILGSEIGLEKKGKDGEQISTGTGVVAVVRGLDSSRSVALRADMDALPVQEDSKNPVKSKIDGAMHGCGHDIHTAALLGTAKLLKELSNKGELPIDVKLMFQPSEEKTFQKESGAVQMVKFMERSGVRDNIEAVFGQHVISLYERGQVNVKEGIQSASSGEIDITLKTKGGHVMNVYEQPSLNRIFSEINTRLYDLFEPLYKENQSIIANTRTDFPKGGYNVLPAEGSSTWVVRISSEMYKSVSKEVLGKIKTVVNEVVEKYSDRDVSVDIKPRPGYRPIVHRDPTLVSMVRNSAKEVIEDVKLTSDFMPAGEDISFYFEELRGKQIPGVFVMVGGANKSKDIPIVAHHAPNFRVDPDVMQEMSALHVAMVLNYTETHKEAPAETR
ncbi:MAG: amidohydrolase [Candidatus Paceibacterota bacterium]|jgi:amidohydrolase